MQDWIQRETEKLVRSWDRHAADDLRDYLVASVEDPCLNVQSVLTRHFLSEVLFGQRFAGLQDQELRFAVAMNWALNLLEHPVVEDDFVALHHALKTGADDAEGMPVPQYLSAIYQGLPALVKGVEVPNYLREFLEKPPLDFNPPSLPAELLSTFGRLWQKVLESEPSNKVSVIEFACGSANDYRQFAACGLARFLDYQGFDLCEKNITNARAMFPDTAFAVGNVLQIAAPDRAYDLALAQDLFEHLSLPALELAMAEICRVTRNGLCLGFFNLHEGPEHKVVPVDDYHWNQLSLPKVRVLLADHGFKAQVIHIGTFLSFQYGCAQTHNENAYTIFAWRD